MYTAFITPTQDSASVVNGADITLNLKLIVGILLLAGLFCIAYALYYWIKISNKNTSTIEKCKKWIAIGIGLCLIIGGGYGLFLYLTKLGYLNFFL